MLLSKTLLKGTVIIQNIAEKYMVKVDMNDNLPEKSGKFHDAGDYSDVSANILSPSASLLFFPSCVSLDNFGECFAQRISILVERGQLVNAWRF